MMVGIYFVKKLNQFTYRLKTRYPNVSEAIAQKLQAIRAANAPLTVVVIKAIFIGVIHVMAPEIFEKK